MKNLLIIAYYFPPSGGPGVQRVLKHVKYLSEFGWNPIVLTVSNGQFPARDESLLKQIPENTQIYRAPILEPYDLYRLFTGKKKGSAVDVNVIKKEGQKTTIKEKIAEFIRATFFIPDARISWYFTSKKLVDDIIQKHEIEAVYSSSPPYTCSLIARRVKRKYKLPWVAGFRDPWTGFISSPKRWFLPRAIDRKMEYSTFNEANAVECAWEGIIKDAIGKYQKLEKSKFIHVPNGFDSNDFPKVNAIRNERFSITYTGSMYGRRNPAAVFKAIQELIDEGKLKNNDFKIIFIGRFGNEIHDMFDNSSFKDSIEVLGYMAHGESIKHLMLSDVLLLIVDESKESEEIVPGKVYEYIGVMKPVLANAPENSAIAKLLDETSAGKYAHQDNISGLKKIIMDYFELWRTEKKLYYPNLEMIKKYERRESTKQLAKLLDNYSK